MEEVIKKSYQKILLVSVALIYGCVMTGGMFFFLIQRNYSSPASGVDVLRQAAWVIGVLSLGLSFVLKQKILAAQPQGSVDPEQKYQQRAARLTTATIIAFALCEGALLFGFMVAFLSKSLPDMYFPCFIGAAGFAAHFPRYAQWKQYIEQH